MANGKAQKRRIRALMAETGMNYTTAMRELEQHQAQSGAQADDAAEPEARMARMLGLSGRDGGGWSLGGSRGASRRLKHRVERHREQHAFDREIDVWFRAPAVYDPASDPSDCAHGCNGDCETWGSERCTFLCHPTDEAVLAAQWAERTGHTTPAGDPDPGVLAKYAEHVRRMREEAEDRADLAIANAVLAEPGELVPLEEFLAELGL